MASLEDIATLISTSTTIVCDAIFFILQLSYLVGQTLVDVSLLFTNYFLRIWDTLSLTLQIVYEDSLVFFQDVGEKCSLIFNFLMDTNAILFNAGISGIISIGNGVSNFGNFLLHLVNTILSALSNVISYMHDGVILIRQMLILLGSSIWLCVTIVPLAAINFTYSVINYFSMFIEALVILFSDIGSLIMFVINFLSDSFHNVILFFFGIPLRSGYGLICGTILLLVFVQNFKNICLFISQGLHKFYCCLKSFSSSLWSGRFLENKKLNTRIELNANASDSNAVNDYEKLCVVCQDNQREIITFPCRHLCLCRLCCLQICKADKACPVCRKHVTKTVKVYMP